MLARHLLRFSWNIGVAFATLMAAVVCLAVSVAAQESDDQTAPKLPVAWASLYPLIYEDKSGEVAGFMVDLSKELGKEIGFEPEFFQVDDFAGWSLAQETGASVLMPGTAKQLPFGHTNLFTEKLFDAEVRLAVRSAEAENFDPTDLAGLRIGTLQPGAGSDPALYPGAQMVNYGSLNDALFDLLAGDIDALSTTNLFVYSAIRKAGLDHLIAFVGPPILESGRYIAIHESHAELLEPISIALAQMKADGRLATLFTKHNMVIPQAAPDVLIVGVSDFPPYSIQNDDGTFSGFGVDTFAQIADLAGLSIEFKAITTEELGAGPTAETYDILPQIGVNAARREVMDFTLPLETNSNSIFARTGETGGLTDLDSLVGRTVGVEEVNTSRRLAESHGGLTVKVFESRTALLQALSEGTVDAILFTTRAMNREIAAQGLTNEIVAVRPPIFVSTRAPALRPGLGNERERLNAVIPGYLISDDYEALQRAYFGEEVFWTPGRINLALGMIAASVLVLLGYIAWQQMQQRTRELNRQKQDLAREKTYANEQRKLVLELERSNRDLDEFAYIASHDMKEPLRGIGINANFLLREELPEGAKKRALRMVHLTGRMEQLISDLLYFSRLGRGDPSPVLVQPRKIIEGIRSDLTEWLDETGGEIVEIGEIPTLKAQGVHVKTVLQNLIVNGIKYSNAKAKRVEVGFVTQVEVNDQILNNAIFVRDNGIGIDEKYREKIFRIFSRLNTEAEFATSSGSGTGSGLAFTRKIVEEYGGVVQFDTNADEGTVFYFTMPVAKIDEQLELAEGADDNVR